MTAERTTGGGKNGFNIYTDLAIESREMLGGGGGEDIDGVRITAGENAAGDIRVTWVEVLDETGSAQMNKPVGNYVTIEAEAMKENDIDAHQEITAILAAKLSQMAKLEEGGVVLAVGLGNWNVTPDALGPRVISKVLVTRHITEAGAAQEELARGMRPVCAVSPGVMGITGIETAEIIKGVVERVKPNLVIAVDALAARRTSRINATVQMSDTGVNPGAGMGNRRASLNKETLGVPVVAIGVPTVVDAATLVNDTLDNMLDAIIEHTERTEAGAAFYDMLRNLQSEEKYGIITQMLDPFKGNMFVTPKEVDVTVDRLSGMIADAVNMAMHPGVDVLAVSRMMG